MSSKSRIPYRDLGPLPTHLVSALDTELGDRSRTFDSEPQKRFLQEISGLSSLVLKFPRATPGDHLDSAYTPDWHHWRPLVQPVLTIVAKRLGIKPFQTSKILLSAMAGNTIIPTHVDTNTSSQVPCKVHVPIRTDSGVVFTVAGTPRHLHRGRAYEINNLLPHAVHNNSDSTRIHLIVEMFAAGSE